MNTTRICRSLSAALLIAGTLVSQTVLAHQSGPRDYSEPTGLIGRATSCRNAHNQAKRILRDEARVHCKTTHDSGSNALQRTNYQRGTCIKTKTPGQPTIYEIRGAVFTATCR